MARNFYDKDWNLIGRESDDGKTVYDRDWNTAGHVSEDGKTFYNKNWEVSGHVSEDGKTFYDAEWNVVGRASDDGKTIYDRDWKTMVRREGATARAGMPALRTEERPKAQGGVGEKFGSAIGEGLGELAWPIILFAATFAVVQILWPILVPVFCLVSRERKRRMWKWLGPGASYFFSIMLFSILLVAAALSVQRELLAQLDASGWSRYILAGGSILAVVLAIWIYFSVKRWLGETR
jgi:hypothetical protein